MAARIIAILQPVYLPWLGYFEQMAVADRFVFMDDVQYTRHDWRNRNRIKTATGSIWLTVPVQKPSRNTRIRDVEIDARQPWPRRHLRSIELAYQKCPYFQPLFGRLQRALAEPPHGLADLDCRLIRLLSELLEIATPTSRSSEVPRRAERGDKNGRIIELCRHFEADVLYDGASAAAFIDVERFRREGIEVVFQDYRHPAYPQLHGEFLSHQSAIDLIMNTGPEAPAILRSSPLPGVLRHTVSDRRAAAPEGAAAR